MSSRLAVKQHSAPPPKPLAQTRVEAHAAVRVKAAANDDKPASEFSFLSDPLFGMAIATVIMLAILAALMAVG